MKIDWLFIMKVLLFTVSFGIIRIYLKVPDAEICVRAPSLLWRWEQRLALSSNMTCDHLLVKNFNYT